MHPRPLRVLCAFDKFKGTLSAYRAGEACLRGFEEQLDGCIEKRIISLSDGGDGFLESFQRAVDVEMHSALVTGPDGKTLISAPYGILLPSRSVCVVESASACGLALFLNGQVSCSHLPTDEVNPLWTTTRGVGELLRHILESHTQCKTIIVGLGGSCTNDGGIGCLQGFGYRIYVRSEKDCPFSSSSSPSPNASTDEQPLLLDSDSSQSFCGADLEKLLRVEIYEKHASLFTDRTKNVLSSSPLGIEQVESHGSDSRMLGDSVDCAPNHRVHLRIACDVDALWSGPNGAAYIFARQKGASDSDVNELDRGMRHAATILDRDVRRDDRGIFRSSGDVVVDLTSEGRSPHSSFDFSRFDEIQGTGAAGGLAGALFCLGGTLERGSDILLSQLNIDELLNWADVLVTGEGSFDAQSSMGKIVGSVLQYCKAQKEKKMRIPHVLLVCGSIDPSSVADTNIVMSTVSLTDEFGRDRSFREPENCIREACQRFCSGMTFSLDTSC